MRAGGGSRLRLRARLGSYAPRSLPTDPGLAAVLSRPGRRSIHSNHFVSAAAVDDDEGADTFRLAVKDNIATLLLPTTCGSNMLAGYTSPFEATIVQQLRRRGARLMGKTNLDEFGMGSHSLSSASGPVVNLVGGGGPGRSAGGSTGGSAVAVAVGDVDVGLGTDTGGSVRLPAAYTGVVGFKPSYGMLSRHGVVPYANSLDTVGLLSRSVRRLHHLLVGLSMWREHDPLDPTSLSTAARHRCARSRAAYDVTPDGPQCQAPPQWPNLVFGVPLEYNIAELHPTIRRTWAAAATLLRGLGAEVVPVSLPSTRHALSAYYVLAPAEASSNLAKYDGVRYGLRRGGSSSHVLYSATRGAGFGDEVRRRILLGSFSLCSEAMDSHFVQAQRVRRLVRRDFNRVFLLKNPLLDSTAEEGDEQLFSETSFSLSDLHGDVSLVDKRGPARVDYIICPTAPTPAPTIDEAMLQTSLASYMNDVFTVPASLAGLPAISLPITATGGGSPCVGLQLVGQYWDDARMLQVASALRLQLGLGDMDHRAHDDEAPT